VKSNFGGGFWFLLALLVFGGGPRCVTNVTLGPCSWHAGGLPYAVAIPADVDLRTAPHFRGTYLNATNPFRDMHFYTPRAATNYGLKLLIVDACLHSQALMRYRAPQPSPEVHRPLSGACKRPVAVTQARAIASSMQPNKSTYVDTAWPFRHLLLVRWNG